MIEAAHVDLEGIAASASQRRMWMMHEFDPEHPAYHVCLPLRLCGRLEIHAIGQTLAAIEKRHPALRSRFTMADSGLRIHHARSSLAHPRLIDLGVGDVDATLQALARQPFDLDAGPVARWTIVRLGPHDHILVLTVHHIVFDGASLAILCDDLQRLSTLVSRGRPAPALTPLESHPDRPMWTQDDLDFWRQSLASPPPPLAIWTGADGGAPSAPSAVTVTRVLDRQVAEDLRRFGRERGLTPFMVLLAALVAVVHRYTGRDDVVVGSPVSLRESEADLASIGLMLNTVALRLNPAPGMSFGALVQQCRDAVLDAIDRRRVPFEEIVDAVRAERSLRFTPLFQVMFAYQPAPAPPSLPGADVTVLPAPSPAAKYGLTLTVTESEGGQFELGFEADSGECASAELQAFAGYLGTLLAAGVSKPDVPIDRLPLVARPDRSAHDELGRPALAAPGRSLAALLEDAVRERPDAIAVHTPSDQVSYLELDRRAGRIREQLLELGAGPERVVGVCLPRSADMIASLLAVAKAGSAYLPLDPQLPPQRLRHMLSDARADILITSGTLAEVLQAELATVRADELLARPRAKRRNASTAVDPAGLAYVLYTSGSTGTPKGVGISHGNVMRFLDWATKEFACADLAATIAVTSIGFDLSVFEMFAPIACGGTLILADGPDGLIEHPGAHRATLLNTVPSVLEALLDNDFVPASLGSVNLAGEPLPRDLVDRLLRRRPGIKVRNLYGPSEATTYVTSALLCNGFQPPPIGLPVAGARIWVVGLDGQVMPLGVSGELLVGGEPVARGYLHRPAATAEAFRPDGLGGQSGARLYHTGDLARRGHDGQLRFLGRADHQVKLRGVRIELEEIEVLLREHETVRDAAVVVIGETPSNRRLVAFVCPAPGRVAVPEELRASLRQRLAEVMVPSGWAMLDELPRSANGKLDRRALGRAALEVAIARSSGVAPRSALEALIASAWTRVLGNDEVGVHDGFFDIGGNSLLLLRLHRLLRDTIDVPLRVVDLFRWPTIAMLAEQIEAHRHRPAPDAHLSSASARGVARRGALERRRRTEAGDAIA